MEVSYLTLPCLNYISKIFDLHFVIKVKINTFRNISSQLSFCNTIYLPYLLSLTFFLLYLGALRLPNPYQIILSFTWQDYLSLHLLHPRAQIKLLSSFLFTLPIYLSAKFKQFGHILFVILQHEIEI